MRSRSVSMMSGKCNVLHMWHKCHSWILFLIPLNLARISVFRVYQVSPFLHQRPIPRHCSIDTVQKYKEFKGYLSLFMYQLNGSKKSLLTKKAYYTYSWRKLMLYALTSYHYCSYVGIIQFLNYRWCFLLQCILHDEEAEKLKVTFNFIPVYFSENNL